MWPGWTGRAAGEGNGVRWDLKPEQFIRQKDTEPPGGGRRGGRRQDPQGNKNRSRERGSGGPCVLGHERAASGYWPRPREEGGHGGRQWGGWGNRPPEMWGSKAGSGGVEAKEKFGKHLGFTELMALLTWRGCWLVAFPREETHEDTGECGCRPADGSLCGTWWQATQQQVGRPGWPSEISSGDRQLGTHLVWGRGETPRRRKGGVLKPVSIKKLLKIWTFS